MYLSLPMSKCCKTLDDCIDLYLKEEFLTGMDQYYCGKCMTHVDGTKKQDLWMLPPVLIVHLKRFKYNDYGKVGSKNDAAIDYPIVGWDLKSHVKSSRGVYPRYDLYAVANHMGGLSGGHYTAHTLNRFDDTWYEFNDSSYRSVNESIHKDLTKSSYVLLYNRSEGDVSMPLNERSPLIRRQSVSRPDLWPHSQVDDPRMVRNFTRASRRHLDPMEPPDLSSRRKDTGESVGNMESIKEGPTPLLVVQSTLREPIEILPGPPLQRGNLSSSEKEPRNTSKRAESRMERHEEFKKLRPRRKVRSTKPQEI